MFRILFQVDHRPVLYTGHPLPWTSPTLQCVLIPIRPHPLVILSLVLSLFPLLLMFNPLLIGFRQEKPGYLRNLANGR